MHKTFFKSESDTWDDIARRAYGTPEKAGDIAKLNNYIESGEILVLEENTSEAVKKNDGVSLISGDNIYTDFSEYSLIDGISSVKGAVFVFNSTDLEYNFSFGDSVEVTDESGCFLKGRIANIKASLDTRANWYQVEIKSNAGMLLESNLPYPLEFRSQTIKEILLTTAGYFNQKITFSDAPELNEVFTNEIGTSFTAKIEETAFDFMNRICKSRGLILSDTGDGLFVGRFNPETEEKLNLIDGECLGVEEMHCHFYTDGLARYYEVNSQYPESASATVQIPFAHPVTKRFNSNDYNSMDLHTTAQRLACSDIGKHFKIKAVISENYHIRSGSFAIVKNKRLKIDKETDFIIEQVIRKNPDLTILTLTLPCAYTFEIPTELPLCS